MLMTMICCERSLWSLRSNCERMLARFVTDGTAVGMLAVGRLAILEDTTQRKQEAVPDLREPPGL